jgi:hypothetical protein
VTTNTEEAELQILISENLTDAAQLTKTLSDDWMFLSFSPQASDAQSDFRKLYYNKLSDLHDTFGIIKESYQAICEVHGVSYQ